MSTIALSTRQLIGLLSDPMLTVCTDPEWPGLCGILLHTTDGEYLPDLPDSDPDQEALIGPVESQLLVATSTDTVAIAQAHAAARFNVPSGWLHSVFVDSADVKAVISGFKPLISTLGREVTHYSSLELSAGTLTVREDPSLVPGGLRMSFAVGDGSTFPPVAEKMQPQVNELVPGLDGAPIGPSYGTGFSPRHLEAFGKIGKRRQMPLAVYRHHQHRAVVVEIGASYRAALMPYELDEDHGQHLAPTVRVFTPPVRDRAEREAAQS